MCTKRSEDNYFFYPLKPQYIFIHDALLEAIECGETEVAAMNFKEQYLWVHVISRFLLDRERKF